ncbi:TlpA family protein disulfide reductase [Flavobacterium sp. N1736]|uniref:TlpA family protein disulfide reductase n=1 Tax=Flavobacterium sp. N1736 TaxID=2986823 RepID=UPI0022244B4B|nr:TlpA disulfide reductase family protein [Flavobacterium sp. N1736]
MKNIFLIAFLLLSLLKVHSQNIEVEVNIQDSKDSTKIWFNKSVDENFSNYFYNCEFATIKNNSFKKTFHLNGSGVMMINGSNFNPKIKLIATKGDKIKIAVKRDKSVFTVKFEGSNASGLEELYNSPYLTRKKLTPLIGDLIPKTKNADEVVTEIENIKVKALTPFKKLLEEKKITTAFYHTLNLDVDLLFLETTYDIVGFYANNPENFKKQQLSTEQLNAVIVAFDKKYNVFDEKYNICEGVSRVSTIEKKCANIKNKILPGEKYDIGLWTAEQEQNNYAPVKYQELIMCSTIAIAGFGEAKCTFEKFKEKFPNSVYLKKLKAISDDEKLSANIPLYSFGTYSNQSKKIIYTETKQYQDLAQLIAEKFKGKFVFVDLWASYCAPCKVEFRYAEGLHKFLNNNNVEILYVSVDNASQIQKWEKDIYGFELKGNHYFASNTILASLKKMLNEKNDVYIPRYLLFNANGELVLKNAKNPSEGENLYSEIRKSLNF